MITQEQLKAWFDYDPITGTFTRKIGKKRGQSIGRKHPNGYIRIWFASKNQLAHQLAWIYVYGYKPKLIDHVNGVRDDNRISNLRDANRIINSQNRRNPNKKKASGLPMGVAKMRKKFRASIRVNYAHINLGMFDTPELAAIAYKKAKEKYHNCHII